MELKKIFSFRESDDEARPFMDHLGDLRVMIIRMAVTLAVSMFAAFFFRDTLASVIQRPLIAVDPIRATSLQSLGVADSMTISIELSFYAGLIISFPILLLFLAQFLFPALKPEIKTCVKSLSDLFTIEYLVLTFVVVFFSLL